MSKPIRLRDVDKAFAALRERAAALEERAIAAGRDLNARVAAIEAHPALSIPPLPDRKPLECHPAQGEPEPSSIIVSTGGRIWELADGEWRELAVPAINPKTQTEILHSIRQLCSIFSTLGEKK